MRTSGKRARPRARGGGVSRVCARANAPGPSLSAAANLQQSNGKCNLETFRILDLEFGHFPNRVEQLGLGQAEKF